MRGSFLWKTHCTKPEYPPVGGLVCVAAAFTEAELRDGFVVPSMVAVIGRVAAAMTEAEAWEGVVFPAIRARNV